MSLDDDGALVVLDLHGTRLEEAAHLVHATLHLAAAAGRDRVRIIHGHSTSDAAARNRTIKHALPTWLAAPALARLITATLQAEGSTLVSLPVGRPRQARRLTVRDIRAFR